MNSPLIIQRLIIINATAKKVWAVLTEMRYSNQWSRLFSPEIPGFHVDSDWKLGSTVNWLGDDGKVLVIGKVLKVTRGKLLHFSVVDVEMGEAPGTDESDGIRFELASGMDNNTTLALTHGDFEKMPDGKKYYDMTVKSWNKIMPKIKELAEKV